MFEMDLPNFTARVERARNQRIYLLASDFDEIHVSFHIMGNSGIAYTINVPNNGKISCSCPDHSINNNFCKHLIFLLTKILRFTTDDVYQQYEHGFEVTTQTWEQCALEGISLKSFDDRFNRAMTQNIFLIESKLSDSLFTCFISGTTRNQYQISIHKDDNIKCNCPDHINRQHLCKHLIYVLFNMLNLDKSYIKFNYSKTFNTKPGTWEQCESYISSTKIRKHFNSKDNCPICLDEFSHQKVLWCKKTCGNYIHTECFLKWCEYSGKDECPICRSDWPL